MKKIIALLLCLLLLSISLVACGGDETTENEGSEGAQAQSEESSENSDTKQTEAATMNPADPYINDALFPELD